MVYCISNIFSFVRTISAWAIVFVIVW